MCVIIIVFDHIPLPAVVQQKHCLELILCSTQPQVCSTLQTWLYLSCSLLFSHRGRKPGSGSSSVCRRGRQHTDDATGVPARGQRERRAWWSTVYHGGTRWPSGSIHTFGALSLHPVSLISLLLIIKVSFWPSDGGRVLSVRLRYSCSLNLDRCSWVLDKLQ